MNIKSLISLINYEKIISLTKVFRNVY